MFARLCARLSRDGAETTSQVHNREQRHYMVAIIRLHGATIVGMPTLHAR